MADAKRITVGSPVSGSVAAVSLGTFILDQSTDAYEVIFQAPEAITITKLGFLTSAKTGTATTWKISLQGVDGTTGNPDGTIKGGGSPASATFDNTGVTAGVFAWFTLANSYTCARGDYLSVVIAYDSGTTPSVGVNDLTVNSTSAIPGAINFPYGITNNAGTRTKLTTSMAVFGYASSTKAYGLPLKAGLNQSYSSGSSPAIWAMRFLLPSGWGSTFQVVGVRCIFAPPAAATTSTTMRLYGGTTVLQDVTIDTEIMSGASTNRAMEFYFDESTLSDLSFGSEYRLAFAPVSGTIAVRGMTVDTASDFDAYPLGQSVYVSSLSAGTWTDVTTSRFFCELILADWTVAAGGAILSRVFTGY